MKTATELAAADIAVRVRARDYEDASNRVSELQRKVTKLATSPHADAKTRLRRILEDSASLPNDLIGTITGLLPLSGVAGTYITSLAATALKTVEQQDARRAKDLHVAQDALDKAERELATFK